VKGCLRSGFEAPTALHSAHPIRRDTLVDSEDAEDKAKPPVSDPGGFAVCFDLEYQSDDNIAYETSTDTEQEKADYLLVTRGAMIR